MTGVKRGRRTLWLDERVWKAVERAAEEESRRIRLRVSISAWIERALMDALGIPPEPFRAPAEAGGG